jgi:hypothetical protein
MRKQNKYWSLARYRRWEGDGINSVLCLMAGLTLMVRKLSLCYQRVQKLLLIDLFGRCETRD